jgi:hypothetical protein
MPIDWAAVNWVNVGLLSAFAFLATLIGGISALRLSTGALGNIRTQTLRAFTQADMGTILGKMVKS